MSIIRKTLLKTIHLERGELYCTVNGNRCLIANCSPKLEIYENESTVSVLGKEQRIKKLEYSLVICYNTEFTRKVDEKYLSSISSFDLKAQVQREDGVFEVCIFNNIIPTDTWEDDNWKFEVVVPNNLKELFNI